MDKEKFTKLAHEAVQQWQCLPDGGIFFTHSSLLWPVAMAEKKLMLKIAKPDDDEAHAADILRYYNGHSAVRLVRNNGSIQLLERLQADPDQPTLRQMVMGGQADAATHIICDVIEQLHSVPLPKEPLKNLIPFRQMSDEIRQHVDEGRVKPLDRPLFQLACELCDELIAETRDTYRVLHGDIHHENILYSSRGWLAIDPKGIFGPRIYEYANTLFNPFPATHVAANPKHMDRQAGIIVERARLDKKLLLKFVFLHSMQVAAWSSHPPFQEHCFACARTAAVLAEINPA
jgi:streptomycin 6-kinase